MPPLATVPNAAINSASSFSGLDLCQIISQDRCDNRMACCLYFGDALSLLRLIYAKRVFPRSISSALANVERLSRGCSRIFQGVYVIRVHLVLREKT